MGAHVDRARLRQGAGDRLNTDRPPTAQPPTTGRSGETFRSLRHPDFRRYFAGQLASMCGSWAQTVAMAWLVLRLTGSGTSVGALTAVQFAPVVLLSAWAGSVADRFDERRSVIVVQVVLGAQASVLAAIVLTDVVELWMLYGLAIVQGTGIAFDTPTRQSLVGRVVGNEDLHNALSLNGGLVQVARVVGPAAAGLLIETVGIGVCFAINAVSYGIVAAAVISIRTPDARPAPRRTSGRGEVVDGIRVIWEARHLRDLLVLALAGGLMGVNFTVGLPVLVRQDHGDDAALFGFLAALYGLGALVGALMSAGRRTPTKGMLLVAMAGLVAGLAAASQGTLLVVLVPGIALAGLAGLTLGVTLNASLQLGAPEGYRGRAIGLYFMVTFGSNVLGGPLIGAVAEQWGAATSFAGSAVVFALVAARFGRRWHGRWDEPLTVLA